jgi:predicted Zn-dependent peptidase
MEYHTTKLKNDLKVVMNRNPTQTTVTICLFVNVGSNSETLDINGISHFIEHLFFKGTTKRPSQRMLSLELDKYGAISNAFTARELTCYHIKVNNDHLSEIVEILGDVMKNSLYREEDIEMEKKVVINEIHQRNSNQNYFISKNMYLQFFKGLPISKSVAGTPENINKINRSIILAFIYKFYRPENMIISVSGNFKSYDSLHNLLENHFGSNFHRNYIYKSLDFKRTVEKLENYKKQWDNVLSLIKPTFKQKSILYHITPKKQDEHTFITMGFSGLKFNDQEKYKALFLSLVLGGGMSSRLFDKVRTKYGLVYQIRASHTSHNDCGLFTIEYSCNHSLKTQIMILKIIKEEIELLKNEPITQIEYQNIISSMENKVKILQEDTYENALHYGIELLQSNTRHLKTYQEIVEEYKKITISDLQQFANQLFDWNKFLVVSYSPLKVFIENYEKIFFEREFSKKINISKTHKKSKSKSKSKSSKKSKSKST